MERGGEVESPSRSRDFRDVDCGCGLWINAMAGRGMRRNLERECERARERAAGFDWPAVFKKESRTRHLGVPGERTARGAPATRSAAGAGQQSPVPSAESTHAKTFCV